ncbi:MAG: hypothetical protein II656_08630 [Ruminococcus sp.]|nr:hypothetical protein [Ruminococcus sp.]
MNKLKITALALAAVMSMSVVTACGSKKSSSAESSSAEEQQEKKVNDWELESPSEGAKDYDLGDYRTDPETGIKLYYEEEQFPRELVLALEHYFLTFEKNDLEAYKAANLPLYNEEWEKYLQKEYKYGIESSFKTRCDSLKDAMEGTYKITRIKVEKSEQFPTEEEGVDDYLKWLGDIISNDKFPEQVKSNCDSLRYMSFYVMAENSKGEENMLVSEYNIIFAEKDGKYYTFG